MPGLLLPWSAETRMLALLLLILVLVIPIVELAVLIRLGQEVGILPTLALLVIMGIVGAWLLRRQGTRVVWQIRTDLEARRIPADRLFDAAVIGVAGVLMLFPGFLTDVVAFLLLVPPVRYGMREFVKRWFLRRYHITARMISRSSVRGYRSDIVEGTVVEESDDPEEPGEMENRKRLEP